MGCMLATPPKEGDVEVHTNGRGHTVFWDYTGGRWVRRGNGSSGGYRDSNGYRWESRFDSMQPRNYG